MDKLYAGTNPIGVISELLLAVLNSNVHVYQVSPVLTLMEIQVTKAVGGLLDMGEVSKKIKERPELFVTKPCFRMRVDCYALVAQLRICWLLLRLEINCSHRSNQRAISHVHLTLDQLTGD